MDMNEAVAKAIGAERSIAGKTIRELSKQSGIPTSSLMRVLQAEREIKINQIAKIAQALEIYPHELVETAENIMERENRKVSPLHAVEKTENVSEGLPTIDPVAMGLAANRDTRDKDTDFD